MPFCCKLFFIVLVFTLALMLKNTFCNALKKKKVYYYVV